MQRSSLYLFKGILFSLLPMIFLSCNNQQETRDFSKDIDSISKLWVPDKREGIFDAKLINRNGTFTLKGETNLPEAKADLVKFLGNSNYEYLDSLQVLPDTSVIKEPWGLINVSVCNMRSEPSHGAEMLSQALLGTPVKIIKKSGGWLKIQTPDNYLGWTNSDAVETQSVEMHNKWKNSSRVIFIEKSGDVYADKQGKEVVSDINAGCILVSEGEDNGYYRLLFPDGRKGFAPVRQFLPFYVWATGTKPEAGKLIQTAFRFMGTPYLWGGTSAKGLDCSGFVKTVYYLNGLILARDASLQIRHGFEIPSFQNLDSLQKGDLLFFGAVRNGKLRATHVGMFIGDTEFIHEPGMVRINSLDSTRANFSRFRRNTFIGARRIIGSFPSTGLQPVSDYPWYK
jgi:gamma-D-glutamyl-L-lysine dipeptidyl-peptidase